MQVIIQLPIFAVTMNTGKTNYTMPTIFILFGFRFMFYANDHEPIHIHVIKGDTKAKFTISPIRLVENYGLKPSELKLVESIIEENEEVIAEHWNKFFNKTK